MDNAGHGRYRIENYNGMHGGQWNMPQFQMKESSSFIMNKKMMNIMAEKEIAINELNRALSEKKYAFDQRTEAFKQRDEAIASRDTARRERDSAIAALRFQENSLNVNNSHRGTKRPHHSAETSFGSTKKSVQTPAISSEPATPSRHRKPTTRGRKSGSSSKLVKKGKKVGEDLNRRVTTDGSKAEWESSQELGLSSQVSFDKSTMAAPVCSCTGTARQCYRWGSGGWQSSCCTTNLSQYPLPQMENKRHSRMSGRKMSGSVFTRLISRLAIDGHDLSMPVDLRDYWAKHGTNRYITIK
ncbi:protein BASIC PENTACYSTEINE5-like [Impatiens glandulifera]|uniref:protein BASIC PENTACYSTEINE5-like n=1 Tax=Impatiens glandulifera TaxID=253017 RepID=UPI001FB11D0D|nr:protein BASIC PENTACYSTEINE5-like [Impatiens glandulifera]XP_047313153.1 protein BASIC PENTACYSTEINE5-like [Impatiens glandulifera]